MGETTEAIGDTRRPRSQLSFAWFGTSLMEHYTAHNPRLSAQADLPAVGELIEVTEWRNRGYVAALLTGWQTRYPWLDITSLMAGEGGATSRDVLASIRSAIETRSGAGWDLAFLGVGINDVWRHHQGRYAEAVAGQEYETNCRAALSLLTAHARQVVVIGEPPIGWDPSIDVAAANNDLIEYNRRARRAADDVGAPFIDLWHSFVYTATELGWSPTTPTAPADGTLSVWSDGVHLSDIGDELLRQITVDQINTRQIIDNLLAPDRVRP